ncbi:MAG: arginase family protein, partial [Halobacteriovoraceae bacterium]|nr:arginase family protein [Halobacteriovoraceae bacterium]
MNSLLCPPGEGVYAVHTAKDKKKNLHQKLYGGNDPDKIRKSWQKSWNNLSKKKAVMLGICSDSGGGILRGANWGPLYLRESLLKEKLSILDLGDIRVVPHLLHDKYLNKQILMKCRKALYGSTDNNYPVAPLSITEYFCDAFYREHPDKRIFAIGGDHSVSYPLVKSYITAKKKQGKHVSLIHFDAHTDLMDERLGVDICFASWVSPIIPLLQKPDHVIQIGIRSSGQDKSYWEEKKGVKQYWISDVLKQGQEKIGEEIVTFLKKEKIDEIYVSFDIDAIDWEYAGATGTPEPGGLLPHQAITIL